jgi:RNA polymerase sigma-70 factor (TIGR02952 family)
MRPFTGSAHRRVLSPARASPQVVAPFAVGAWGTKPPCWRSAFDLLWAAVADDARDTVRSGVAAPGGAISGGGPRAPLARRSEDVDARVVALVDLAKGGDREAFAQLYDSYVGSVYRYLLVRVGDRALAEDLTSETFLRALRRIDSFSWQGKDIAAWFITIARNLVADHVKSARFRFEVTTADLRDADEGVDAPDDEVLGRERDDRLLRAIRSLRPNHAECLTLRFLQGLTLAETARVLGRSEGAVKQLQLRAIRALRDALEDFDR